MYDIGDSFCVHAETHSDEVSNFHFSHGHIAVVAHLVSSDSMLVVDLDFILTSRLHERYKSLWWCDTIYPWVEFMCVCVCGRECMWHSFFAVLCDLKNHFFVVSSDPDEYHFQAARATHAGSSIINRPLTTVRQSSLYLCWYFDVCVVVVFVCVDVNVHL